MLTADASMAMVMSIGFLPIFKLLPPGQNVLLAEYNVIELTVGRLVDIFHGRLEPAHHDRYQQVHHN
jgi:hypothetical protein